MLIQGYQTRPQYQNNSKAGLDQFISIELIQQANALTCNVSIQNFDVSVL